jgi:hypothetical protein
MKKKTLIPDPSLKRTYEVGPGGSSSSSTLSVNKPLMHIPPCKLPKKVANSNPSLKMHKASTFYSSASTAVPLRDKIKKSTSIHPASTSTTGVRNTTNIPAALGAPIEKTQDQQGKFNFKFFHCLTIVII